eukprot:687676-Pelagomonas_calceolata.AAC.2
MKTNPIKAVQHRSPHLEAMSLRALACSSSKRAAACDFAAPVPLAAAAAAAGDIGVAFSAVLGAWVGGS